MQVLSGKNIKHTMQAYCSDIINHIHRSHPDGHQTPRPQIPDHRTPV